MSKKADDYYDKKINNECSYLPAQDSKKHSDYYLL